MLLNLIVQKFDPDFTPAVVFDKSSVIKQSMESILTPLYHSDEVKESRRHASDQDTETGNCVRDVTATHTAIHLDEENDSDKSKSSYCSQNTDMTSVNDIDIDDHSNLTVDSTRHEITELQSTHDHQQCKQTMVHPPVINYSTDDQSSNSSGNGYIEAELELPGDQLIQDCGVPDHKERTEVFELDHNHLGWESSISGSYVTQEDILGSHDDQSWKEMTHVPSHVIHAGIDAQSLLSIIVDLDDPLTS